MCCDELDDESHAKIFSTKSRRIFGPNLARKFDRSSKWKLTLVDR